MKFLEQRSNEAIKRELQGLLDSYHHYWDPLAELLQNARDAITRAQGQDDPGPHFIRVSIDAASRQVEVTDNGVGIPQERIQEVLAPGGGDKSQSDGEVGEKGVGLTYSIFCSGEFEIESRTEDGEHYSGRVTGASAWLQANDQSTTAPEYEDLSATDLSSEPTIDLCGTSFPMKSFTRVRLAAIAPSPQAQDLFALSSAQLKFLLSTRTALGVTAKLFEDKFIPAFKAFYQINIGEGGAQQGELEVGYPPPHTYVTKAKSLDEVTKAFVKRKTDTDRRKYLKDTAVWACHEAKQGSDDIRVYGAMLTGNQAFAEITEGLGLGGTDDEPIDDALFRSGLFLCTKGMPTGVEISNKTTGQYPAYYRRCVFMVESNTLRFDWGRKGLHWRQQRRLQEAVSELFGRFVEVVSYQGEDRAKPDPGAAPAETKAEREARRKEEWKSYRGLVDLEISEITYEKVPGGQEAAVAAIFHELLGANVLKHYRPLSTGYRAQYDLHALYEEPGGTELELVIEFKHALDSIVKDLEDGQKYLEDIHLLVAWTADKQKLKNAGFILEPKTNDPFDGVTHEVTLPTPGSDTIPVILLEDLQKRLSS